MNAINLLRATRRQTAWLAPMTLLAWLTGCSTASALPSAQPLTPSVAKESMAFQGRAVPLPLPPERVVRAGRYTLIELGPDDGQRDLMQQVVQTSIPPSADATVGDALRFLLFRTGYQLCDPQGAQGAHELYALPLPAAHLRIGPMTLRQALLTLIGPAWSLQIDEASRRVCIAPMASLQSGAASAAKPGMPPSTHAVSSAHEQVHPSEVRP